MLISRFLFSKKSKPTLRIAFVEPCYENYGGYHRAIGLAKALAKKGVEVDVYASSRKKYDWRIRRKELEKNLTVYTLPRFEFNFFLTARFLRGILVTIILLFKKYNIIHLFAIAQFESNIPLVILSPIFRNKIVVDWDDHWTSINEVIPFYNKFWGIIPRYFYFAEYLLQRLAKHATATSDFLLNEFKKIGINKTLKIINGVNPDEFGVIDKNIARKKLNIPIDQKMLLTFGHTYFADRAKLLLTVFEKIIEKDRDVNLYMNLPVEKLIEEYAPNINLSSKMRSKITSVGFLNKKQLSLYLSACDAVLFLTGESSYEKACFPIRIGAFINGESVVISNETDTEAYSTLSKHECVISSRNLTQLANKTIQYLNNKNQQELMKNNVRKTKKILSWDQLSNRLLEFYQSILAE